MQGYTGHWQRITNQIYIKEQDEEGSDRGLQLDATTQIKGQNKNQDQKAKT